jgi:lupus La protein
MQKFRPVEKVAEALKESKDLLEVSEDGESVRRKKPLVEPKPEQKTNQFQRSVYAKGFGEESDDTQEAIEKFFEQFGEVKQVRLRRTDDKKFKGSVFVEFADLEDAQKFVALDPKPKWGDDELLTMSKQAYVEMKAAEHGFTQNANGKKRGKRFNAFEQIRKGGDQHQNKRQKRNYQGRDNRDRRAGPQKDTTDAAENAAAAAATSEEAKDVVPEAPKAQDVAQEATTETAPAANDDAAKSETIADASKE